MNQSTRPTALITGAAKRIGRTIALHLATHGWNIAVHYHRSEPEANEVVTAIEAEGGRAVSLKADLSIEDQVAGLLSAAIAALGPVSCLINNASIFEDDTFDTATRQSWDRHIETNLRAPFVLTQSFADLLPPAMDGNIINIIDQRVWNLTPHFSSYTISKAGLWVMTRTAALALAPRIRVNAIGPGPTLPSERQTDQQFDAQWQSMPLQRPATADDIAASVRYLLETRSITGQMIALDSGQHLGWAHHKPSDIVEE